MPSRFTRVTVHRLMLRDQSGNYKFSYISLLVLHNNIHGIHDIEKEYDFETSDGLSTLVVSHARSKRKQKEYFFQKLLILCKIDFIIYNL